MDQRRSGAAGAGRGEERDGLPGSPPAGPGGAGAARARPQRGHGREGERLRASGLGGPGLAPCAASHGLRRAAQRQPEPCPGATFRTSLEGTGGADLARVPKAPFPGAAAAGRVRGDGAGALPLLPRPPGPRLGGTRACTGADISHQALATGCPRASLPPCHKNKPLVSSARCVPSREVAAVRTGTICPAIPGDADIFL